MELYDEWESEFVAVEKITLLSAFSDWLWSEAFTLELTNEE